MTLRVGAGKACISPTADLFPFSGFAGSDPKVEVHDDLYTRAIVIDNGEKLAAIVNFDLGMLPPWKEMVDTLQSIMPIEEKYMFFAPTHNHGAPHARPSVRPAGMEKLVKNDDEQTEKFTAIVYKGLKEAVEKAYASLRPARYGFGTGQSWINVNRDKQFEDGYWMQDNNYAGYADKTLAVIKFVDEEDKLIAAVLNYACHAVLTFIGKDADGKCKVSGDIPGYTEAFVERRFGNDAVVLWTPAAEGNVNPVIGTGVFTYLDDGYGVRTNLPDGTAFILQASLGGQHAIDSIKVINSITEYKDTMDIQADKEIIPLPAQKPPVGADMGYNRLLVDNIVPLGPNGEHPEKKLVQMEDDPDHPFMMELKVLKLGDIAVLGSSNDVYSEIGRDMKAASPMKNTIVVVHTNPAINSYIPDKTAKDHLTFQAYGYVKPGACDELIVEGMLRLFDKLEK